MTALTVFLLSFLLGLRCKPVFYSGCRSPPANLDDSKKFRLEVKEMSFNYGREEKKWRLRKETEEKELRDLGVDGETIEKLRTYDWAAFNSDRRYYCRLKESGTYLEDVIRVDRLTLQIALWKMVFPHSPDLKRSLASGCYIGGAYRLNSTALPSLSHPSQAGLMLSRSCPPTTLSTLSAACSSLPSCFLSSSARSANSGLRGNRAAGQKTYPWYKPCIVSFSCVLTPNIDLPQA